MTIQSLTIKLLQFRILLLFILIITWAGYGWAQVESPKQRFEVSAIRGCAPLQVTATNTSGLDPSQFPIVWNMNWDGDLNNIVVDKNQSAAQADTTYTTPGIYQILQVIGNQSDPIDMLTIEVLPDNPPDFRISNCISNTIFIDFSQDTVFDNLIIDYEDGTIDTVSVSDGNTTHQYSSGGDYTVSVQGTFENGGMSCSVYETTITTIDDLDIAQINIVRVNEPQEIEIAYNLNDPNVSYRLEVAENNSTDFSFASIDLNSESSVYPFTDNALDTRNNYYCFRIVAVNRCDESFNRFSNVSCSISLAVTPEDLQNQLDWQSEGYSSFFINRDGNRLDTVMEPSYTDTDVVCQKDYFYTISGQSGNAISISNRVNVTAIATAIPPVPIGMTARLRSQGALLRWPSVPEAEIYLIYRSEGGGTAELYDSLLVSPSQQFTYTEPEELTIDVRYCYQLSYRDECRNESELSEEACILIPRQARIYFPNAFTPNGDGLNDIFVYKANLLSSVDFTIYNRWGELIFASQEIGEGWDGTYGDSSSQQGTYLYQLKVVDELGNSFSRTGSFKLLGSMP